MPQELTKALGTDLSHAAPRRPVANRLINQILRPFRGTPGTQQLHRHGEDRPVVLIPGARLDGVAMQNFLLAEPLQGLLPGLKQPWTLALKDLGRDLQTVPLTDQCVDVAHPHQGITHRPLAPVERQHHRLHRPGAVTHLQAHSPPVLPHAPAGGGGVADRAAKARYPGLLKSNGWHEALGFLLRTLCAKTGQMDKTGLDTIRQNPC